jgi:hypothetical protein
MVLSRDYRRGFVWDIGFINQLYTRLGITRNYRATANLHNSQITTATAKYFPARCVFTSRSLITASNSGDSSALRALVLCERRLPSNCLISSQTPVQNWLVSQSQSHFTTGGLPHHQFILAPSPFRLTATIFFNRTLAVIVITKHPLWREDGSVVRICCWFSPAQSFSGQSTAESWPHFTISDSRLPQPGGPGPHIYISQGQGGPFIPSGTGFPFRRLLRLAGIRWRYSTPPPHGTSESESYVKTDGQSASLSWNKAPIWGLRSDFLLADSCGFEFVGRSLWREDGSVVYNCCWA